MDRRRFITAGVASLGGLSASGSAREQEYAHSHGDPAVTYLTDNGSHRYFTIDQNGELKLCIINKETDRVVVKDYDRPYNSKQMEKRDTDITRSSKDTTSDAVVYEVGAKSAGTDEAIMDRPYSEEPNSGQPHIAGSVNVIRRAGERNDHLDRCFDSSVGSHEWNVLCVELNEHVAAVGKGVLATQILRVAAQRAPAALAAFLTKHRIEAALTALGVSTLTGGDTLSFGVYNWDQSIPGIGDQKMSSGKVGVTDFKPDHDSSALITWMALPTHEQA